MEEKTIINLENSRFAHDFEGNELIHKSEYRRVMTLIEDQLKEAGKKQPEESCQTTHYYNTISVFGERGSGKTSFLRSLLKDVEKKHKQDVHVLGLIDPTLIEEKEHIFILVVSLINDAVESKIKAHECCRDSNSYHERLKWRNHLQRLAKGLPSLEKVGTDHRTQQWQSHEFIMERGLDTVHSAFNLEKDFHELVACALNMLEKKVFLLALDDIDVDMKKGWDVLEMLRKYITTPQIVTLLSGNLKLYSLNVRKYQWRQMADIRKYEPENDYRTMVSELEGQYMQKVLKPEYRVHLLSLYETTIQNSKIVIKDYDSKDLQTVYGGILNGFGIKSKTQVNLFRNYLLGLSVRTQIQFLLSNKNEKNKNEGNKKESKIERVEAFLSRLYAANVNVNLITNNVQMLNILILRYILAQKSEPDLYLLMPNNSNGDVNACLTAFSFLFAEETSVNPFLIWDYFIRMGYMRNVYMGLPDDMKPLFYDRIGLKEQMSLKNNIGLSIAYGINIKTLMNAHIQLYGFEGKDKTSVKEGRIDYEVRNKANRAQQVLAYIPLSIIRYTDMNITMLYYSFFNLIAAITEILKASQEGIGKDDIKKLLINLQGLRAYPTWTREGDLRKSGSDELLTDVEINEDTYMNDSEDDTSLDILVDSIWVWLKEYSEHVPPYLIGRIATRAYYAINNIRENNLGDQMYMTVIAFLNACLIEEMTEKYTKSDMGDSIDKLNISNVRTNEKVFNDNIRFVLRNNAKDDIKLTIWMARCPLIWGFTRPDFWKNSDDGESKENIYPSDVPFNDEINVYDVLKGVLIKSNNNLPKPPFKAGKDDYQQTAKLLRSAGYNPNRIMNAKRAIKDIIAEIARMDLFSSKPNTNQIKAFRRNYKLEDVH